jgi:hypothetical protein
LPRWPTRSASAAAPSAWFPEPRAAPRSSTPTPTPLASSRRCSPRLVAYARGHMTWRSPHRRRQATGAGRGHRLLRPQGPTPHPHQRRRLRSGDQRRRRAPRRRRRRRSHPADRHPTPEVGPDRAATCLWLSRVPSATGMRHSRLPAEYDRRHDRYAGAPVRVPTARFCVLTLATRCVRRAMRRVGDPVILRRGYTRRLLQIVGTSSSGPTAIAARNPCAAGW